MAIDLDALKVALEAEPQYDALVRSGANGLLTILLNTEDVALPKRWRSLPVDTFLDIVASVTFTPVQEARFRLYLREGANVRLDLPNIRAWIQGAIALPSVQNALTAAGEVNGRLGDQFTDENYKVSLPDVRRAVAQISKSLIRVTGQN